MNSLTLIRRSVWKHARPLCFGLVLALGSVTAEAVHVSPYGLGQVLLYPYYTVRGTSGGLYNTLFSVTNTGADTKVIRVRFRESRNGRSVADINVFLTPFDSWTGAVIPRATGPVFITLDGSCTDPDIRSDPPTLVFSNGQYSGANQDGEDPSVDRAAEGYIEVFEMGVLTDASLLTALVPDRANQLGVQPDCAPVRGAQLDNASMIVPPTGGLMGSAYIINVLDGTLYPYDATALDDFTRISLWTPPTATAKPTLEDVNPKVSDVVAVTGYLHSTWDPTKGARPADPVSAVLMRNQILNYFVLDPGTRSGTDWIVTMPTKPYYVPVANPGVSAALPPFESVFKTGGAPDYFGTAPLTPYASKPGNTQIYNREGAYFINAINIDLPPPLVLLPWTANAVTFNNSNIFAATFSGNLGVYSPGSLSPDGWARLEPYQYTNSAVHQLVSTDTPPVTYFGLPMIGFMANDYVNGTLPGPTGPVLADYGATSPHKGLIRLQ